MHVNGALVIIFSKKLYIISKFIKHSKAYKLLNYSKLNVNKILKTLNPTSEALTLGFILYTIESRDRS